MYDGQWQLQYPGVLLTLGSSPLLPPSQQRGYHHLSAPAVSEVELEVDDQRRPLGDGVHFGQDFQAGTTITFELGLRGDTPDDALALSRELLGAWRGDAVRDTPGEVATLCTSNLGRLRQCYGRPRRASTQHTRPRSGLMLATCDFKTVNDLWYDPTPSAVQVPIVPPPSGGATFPSTFPMAFVGNSSTVGSVSVGGDAPTWPIVTIHGPILNPEFSLVNHWTIKLNVNIADGAQIKVDTRPWVRTVLSGTGGSYAGALSRTSRMDRAVMMPGDYTVALKGTDPTGTSSMTFTWHNAYNGM